MPWNNFFSRPEHQELRAGLQAILQDENDVFHNAIIALERLEQCLNATEHQESHLLIQTAIGTKGDHHTAETNKRDKEGWLTELLLQCQTIYFNSDYDDKEVFDAAAKLFVENLLEWYAGRRFLSYYDIVDSCVIPLILAISHQRVNFEDIFKKYVYDITAGNAANATLEQKYEQTKEGFAAYTAAGYIIAKEQNEENMPNNDIITSHKRGNASDGYRRIINGLTSPMCETAAPAKLFYKEVLKYLPEVVASIPEINETSIDAIFTARREKIEETDKKETKHGLEALYPKIKKIIADILDFAGIDYKEITINIQ